MALTGATLALTGAVLATFASASARAAAAPDLAAAAAAAGFSGAADGAVAALGLGLAFAATLAATPAPPSPPAVGFAAEADLGLPLACTPLAGVPGVAGDPNDVFLAGIFGGGRWDNRRPDGARRPLADADEEMAFGDVDDERSGDGVFTAAGAGDSTNGGAAEPAAGPISDAVRGDVVLDLNGDGDGDGDAPPFFLRWCAATARSTSSLPDTLSTENRPGRAWPNPHVASPGRTDSTDARCCCSRADESFRAVSNVSVDTCSVLYGSISCSSCLNNGDRLNRRKLSRCMRL